MFLECLLEGKSLFQEEVICSEKRQSFPFLMTSEGVGWAGKGFHKLSCLQVFGNQELGKPGLIETLWCQSDKQWNQPSRGWRRWISWPLKWMKVLSDVTELTYDVCKHMEVLPAWAGDTPDMFQLGVPSVQFRNRAVCRMFIWLESASTFTVFMGFLPGKMLMSSDD